MGWVNYLIIPKLKLMIEISRYTDDLEPIDYERLKKIFNEEEDPDELIDLDKKYTDLTINDLNKLLITHGKYTYLTLFKPEHFLMYLLRDRNIDYVIESEFELEKHPKRYKGYTLIDFDGEITKYKGD